MHGISFLTTSPGDTSTKSTAQGFCPAPRATVSSCAPLHLCVISEPLRLVKSAESARQRYVLPFFRSPRLALKNRPFHFSIQQSAPGLGLRVLVALHATMPVNMHPRLYPIPPLQIPPRRRPLSLVVLRAARPEKTRRYRLDITRNQVHPLQDNHRGLIIVLSSRQRCLNSSRSIIIPTVVHTGRVPLQAMTVRWRSRGNSTTTRGCSRTPQTIRMPLHDSGYHL